MVTRRQFLTRTGAICAAGAVARPAFAAGDPSRTLKLGILQFGTAAWEIAAMRALGLDAAGGFALAVQRFATNDAGRIAFQAGAVDAIVTDLFWAARVRADGRPLSFLPFSSSEGAVMVPQGAAIKTIADLAGKKLGVAGGPLDKSWLLLQARAQESAGLDLATAATPAFAAPPLLAAKLESGELDAALLYWTFCARLEPKGFQRLVSVADLVRALGVPREPALVGYVFDGAMAARDPALIDAFAAASSKTKAALASKDPAVSDPAWAAARALMQAGDGETFAALKRGFVDGVPEGPLDEERAAAQKLFAVLVRLGGSKFAGAATSLPADLYWSGAAGSAR